MTDDTPRPAAPSRDEFTLRIEDVAARYESAGHPRTIRTLQRYCASGHLDCIRQETPFGDQFLVTPASVARHIAQIAELAAAVGHDQPRLAATHVAAQRQPEIPEQRQATTADTPRSAATEERYVTRLEDEVVFLRGQVVTKDAQIKELTERSRETNHLIAGLQRMLSPLLGSPDPHPPTQNNHDTMQAQ